MKKARLSLLGTSLLLLGCSRTYITTPFEKLSYPLEDAAPGIEVGYHPDALSRSGNRRFQRLARREGFEILAVKIVNRTEGPFVLRDGLEFTSEGVRLDMVPADTLIRWVQHRGGGTPFLPSPRSAIPMVIGSQVSKHRAVRANEAFGKEITGCDLLMRTLPPGEQAIGCLLFRGEIGRDLVVRARFPRPPGPRDSTASTGSGTGAPVFR